MDSTKKSVGFTIVELLIVIVVIAIIAAITIIAYTGIQDRAKTSSVQSDVANAVKQLESAKVVSSGEVYPSSAANANLKTSGGNTVSYYYDSTINSYCVEYVNGNIAYSASSVNPSVQPGVCSRNGLVGQWRFNGNANDAVGSNNGTVSGALSAVGQTGAANTAYSFSNGARIDLGNGYGNVSAITKSIWVNLTSNPSGYGTIFDIGNPMGTGVMSMYIETAGTGSSGVMFGARVESNGSAFSGSTNQHTIGMAFNGWHHVVQVVSRNYMNVCRREPNAHYARFLYDGANGKRPYFWKRAYVHCGFIG